MTNQHGLKKSDRGISTQSFENRPYTFRGEDFLSFHYSHIRQKKPRSLAAMFFLLINMTWRNLIESHISFFRLVAMEFCMNPNNLKAFWWGHWEDAFCEVSSSRLTHWLQSRRCWRTTEDARRTKGDHNNSPWALRAQVS